MPHILKSTTARIVMIVALLLALYAAAGFLIAPKLVRSALLKEVPQQLPGVRSAVGDIRINPFLLQLEIKSFSLAGRGGEKLVGFDRLFVDFELSSLWHRAYSFVRIDLDAPTVDARVAADGTLNLLALRPAPKQRLTTKAQEGQLPAILITTLKVSRGTASYLDRSRPSEFEARLEPIEFELRNFSTGLDGGRFTFTGSTKEGERLLWRGHLSVQPLESDGEIQIEQLHARTIWDYLKDRLNFEVNSGRIDASASYLFALKETALLSLKVSKFTLADLTVRPRNGQLDWITLPQLRLSGATLDTATRRGEADALALDGLKISSWRDPDGSINLLTLAALPGAAPPPAAPAPALSVRGAAAPAAAPPWQFALHTFALRDASVSVEDRTTAPAVKMLLAPLSLAVSGASLDVSKPLHLSLATRINQSGSLAAEGDLTPEPLSTALKLKLAGLELSALQPYIAQQTSMTVRSGRLGGDGDLHYAAAQPKSALQFSGNVRLEKLRTVDEMRHDDFVDWDSLELRRLVYQQSPDRLDIAEILARKPYARVTIEPDYSLSVKRVLSAPGSAPAAAPAPSAAPAPRAQQARARAADSAPPAPAAAPPMPMSIKKVTVQQATVNFTDLSLKPNFTASIQSLDGSVVGLSSKPNSRATVDLHGTVNSYSPVAITGEVNLLSAALYSDIAMGFRNIELSIFNPYSGKFAGYNITKGKLTTELHYKVEGRKLDAQHHVVIDQLEFGDKTASKDAVSLPIKLAVALLKDRHGVIDLNVPVNGTLDDPKFRLGPIIWKVIVNILEKAVTAPFALLGRLFGGGPDIQYVDFQPGNAAPDAAGMEKLKAVAKALQERPQLKIDVPIGFVPDLDRPALAAAKLDEKLRAMQLAHPARKAKDAGAAPAPFAQLDPAIQLDLLAELYAREAGAPPKYPDTVAAIKPKPDATAAKIEFLSTDLRGRLAVGEADLRTLGEQRATALQQMLLGGTEIDPGRVFLVANDKATARDGVVRLELSLK